MPLSHSLQLHHVRGDDAPAAQPLAAAGQHGTRRSDLYSDQDIELVHAIVELAEAIHPTLPERERLPTNALFLAAEELLPRHGYDPEHAPHIARLIFKIGGHRSGNNLADKFKAVLEGLGIRIQFVRAQSPAESRAESRAVSPAESRAESLADSLAESPAEFHTRFPAKLPADSSAEFSAEFPAEFPAELPADSLQLDDLEAKLEELKRQDAQHLLSAWHAASSHAKQNNDHLRAFAVEYDNNDLLGEVLDIWWEEAADAEEQRLEAEAAVQHEAYVAKMERRATRAYEILTIRTLLDKWQDATEEELERTEAARRHLLRKRTFEGWHTQHVEDETKVQNFILNNTLQTWSQVTLHHEVRSKVATHWHEQQLCKEALHTMYEESLGGLADEFHHTTLAKRCLETWTDQTRTLGEEHRVAAALDERLLLDEVFNIWLEETEQQQYDSYEAVRQFLVQGCQRDLDYWQEQAQLSALLRQFTAQDEAKATRDALKTWHGLSNDAQHNTQVADAFMAKESVDHWEREMKLKIFLEHEEYETKTSVLEQWALQEKLIWYQRHLETRDKRQTLDTLLSAAHQVRTERERHEQEAAYVDNYHTQSDVIDDWLTEFDKMSVQYQNAELINLYRTTKPCIEHWKERCHQNQARDTYYTKKADRNRARSLVSGVLDKWPDIAEAARRERMMSSLRQFRRKYKVELAQECFGKWLKAAADAVDTGRDAHDVNLHYKREDVNDHLDFWNLSARRATNLHHIAADAELEVYCEAWQGQLHENQDNMEDAVEIDEEQTRKRCWEKWEFQTLQQGSKRHLADTIHEKNERRVRRKIFYDWQEKAVPGATTRLANPRRSTLSRRSVRLARSSQHGGGGGGFYTASQLATFPPSLGPMPEFDEEPDAVSTPTRWTGGPAAAESAAAMAMATTTPSAILATPFERRLRQEYGARVAFAGIEEESGDDIYL